MIDEQADRYVAAIKEDALRCNPNLRIPYCVWCRKTLKVTILHAMCEDCDVLYDEYKALCAKQDVEGTAKGFSAFVESRQA